MAKEFTGCTFTNHASSSLADRVSRFLIEAVAQQNQRVVTRWSSREWRPGDERLVERHNGMSTAPADRAAG